METANVSRAGQRLDAALAGLQAGTVGVLALLAFVGLASAFYRHSFWTPENLMATIFYGDAMLGRGFSWRTLAGLATYLIVYSLLGALFAALARSRGSRALVTAVAVLAAVAWYLLLYGALLKAVDPLIPLYTHDRPMLFGHLLYGLLLGRFAVYLPPRRNSPLTAQKAETQG